MNTITTNVIFLLLFIILQNFWNYCEYYIQLCVTAQTGLASRQPVNCECLTEAVLLTPQWQHGSLAQTQCCELKLWPWRHVGGRSYVVSTFYPSSSSSPYSCTSHTDLWPSSMRPRGRGLDQEPCTWVRGDRHKSRGGDMGARVLGGKGGEVTLQTDWSESIKSAMINAWCWSGCLCGSLAVPSR